VNNRIVAASNQLSRVIVSKWGGSTLALKQEALSSAKSLSCDWPKDESERRNNAARVMPGDGDWVPLV